MWSVNLRFFSILAVIILHVSGKFVGGYAISNPYFGSPPWWIGNIFDSLSRWCVPLFIMVSGYYLLNKKESNSVFFKKRLSKIAIPLVFWSIFFSIWTIIKNHHNHKIPDIYHVILENFISGSPYYHLWYLFMIPFLYIITPYLRILITNTSKKELLFLIVFMFSISMINEIHLVIINTHNKALFTNLFLSYIGYFILGGYLKKYPPNVNAVYCSSLFLIFTGLTIVGTYLFGCKYFYSNLSVNVVLSSIFLFILFKLKINFDLKVKSISQETLGIYLIHPFFLDLINFLLKNKNYSNKYTITYIMLVSFVVFICSYTSIIFIKKIKPLRYII